LTHRSNPMAWGYVRTSQPSKEISITEQEKQIRNYVDDLNLHLHRIINDGDRTSGFNSDREGYRKLKDALLNKDIQAVVVIDRSRLSRDFDERIDLLRIFRTTGVQLHCLKEGGLINLEDVQVAGMECMHAMSDQFKKKLEIERSREAIASRIEKGYDQGRPPKGFKFDTEGKYWVPDRDGEFDTIVEAIEVREGGATFPEIEDEFGIPPGTMHAIVENKNRYLDVV